MPASLLARLANPDTFVYMLAAHPGQIKQVSETLGERLPGSLTINLVAYAARYTRQYHQLFMLALFMSGLSLLAGVLLVANSVSLAILNRRYEIGILKAVGYSRAHIFAGLAIEYSVVALIATLAALAAVQAFLWFLSEVNDVAANLLSFEPASVALIVVFGVGLVLVTVLLVSLSAARQSPAVVLNDRS